MARSARLFCICVYDHHGLEVLYLSAAPVPCSPWLFFRLFTCMLFRRVKPMFMCACDIRCRSHLVVRPEHILSCHGQSCTRPCNEQPLASHRACCHVLIKLSWLDSESRSFNRNTCLPILTKSQILLCKLHLEVDCATPLQLLYAKYVDTMDINGHLGKCTAVQTSGLELQTSWTSAGMWASVISCKIRLT